MLTFPYHREAPATVVGQMPVENVELELRHRIEQALDVIDRLEMARRIQHEATPAETRRVVDLQCRQSHAAAFGITRVSSCAGIDRAVVQALGVAGMHAPP